MPDPILVLCVDDHAFLAEGLASRLALEDDLEFVGHLPNANGLVAAVKEYGADVVLLDIDMPGADPFEALRDLAKRVPTTRTIILSAHVRDHYFDAATDAGAWGYLSKSDPPASIVSAIRDAAAGRFTMSPEVEMRCWTGGGADRDQLPRTRLSALTGREREVLRLIGRGLTRSDIARVLHRSPKTVDAHQSSIMRKLDIHERTELVLYAVREGLVEL